MIILQGINDTLLKYKQLLWDISFIKILGNNSGDFRKYIKINDKNHLMTTDNDLEKAKDNYDNHIKNSEIDTKLIENDIVGTYK